MIKFTKEEAYSRLMALQQNGDLLPLNYGRMFCLPFNLSLDRLSDEFTTENSNNPKLSTWNIPADKLLLCITPEAILCLIDSKS